MPGLALRHYPEYKYSGIYTQSGKGGGDEMKIDAVKATVPETSLSKGQ